MKKSLIILSTIILISVSLSAQNTNTTVSVPNGAVLVPGTQQLYTTSSDEVSKMMRSAAVSACITHGEGWRLPTMGELQIMFSHRYEMDFGEGRYWSGDKVRGELSFYALNFKNGKTMEERPDKEFFVRCVWTPKQGTTVSPVGEVTRPVAPEKQETTVPAEQTSAPKTTVEPAPAVETAMAPSHPRAEKKKITVRPTLTA